MSRRSVHRSTPPSSPRRGGLHTGEEVRPPVQLQQHFLPLEDDYNEQQQYSQSEEEQEPGHNEHLRMICIRFLHGGKSCWDLLRRQWRRLLRHPPRLPPHFAAPAVPPAPPPVNSRSSSSSSSFFYGVCISSLALLSCSSMYLSALASRGMMMTATTTSSSSTATLMMLPGPEISRRQASVSVPLELFSNEFQGRHQLLQQQQGQQQRSTRHPPSQSNTSSSFPEDGGVSSSFASGKGSSPPRPPRRPAIAWLISFPNSGTTYTIANTEHVTNRTTATNYAIECSPQSPLTPLYPDYLLPGYKRREDAPFLFSPHLDLPAQYVLTKTHCAGYSDDRPWTYDLHDPYSFESFCRFGFVNRECGRRNPKFYTSIDNVQKLVHLIRSPFDNLVARMHLGVSERRKNPVGAHDSRFLSEMNDTPQGLRNWCEYVDAQFHKLTEEGSALINNGTLLSGSGGGGDDGGAGDGGDSSLSDAVAFRKARLSPRTLERLLQVPCHSEIFRYTQFHNLVNQMVHDPTLLELVSPPLVIYYEDYSTDLEGVTQRLGEYLDQPVLRPSLPFATGKTYGHLWTRSEQERVADLVHDLATPETWRLLRRYFPWWQQRDDDGSNESHAAASLLITTPSGSGPSSSSQKIIWLLSYPTAGSNYLLKNLYYGSSGGHILAASNSPVSPRRVWPDRPRESPYYFQFSRSNDAKSESAASGSRPADHLSHGAVGAPTTVVTQNLCPRWSCMTCQIPDGNAAEFEHSCRVVPTPDPDIASVPISLNNIREMLVLVRNPFDVMRSRSTRGLMALAMDSTASSAGITAERVKEIRNTRPALLLWCARSDSNLLEGQFSAITSSAVNKSEDGTNPGGSSSWWTQARDLWAEVAECPSRWLAERTSDRCSRLRQNKAVADKEYTEFPVDWELLKEFRELPCHSDWLRMVQWYNHALEFSEPRRTAPRRTLRFEDYVKEGTRDANFRGLAASLLGGEIPAKRRRHVPWNLSRARHKMLYTDSEARLAARFVKTFGSRDVWELFRGYFEGETWYQGEPK